jgi:tetratricopeptide (TPR) repeat protein
MVAGAAITTAAVGGAPFPLTAMRHGRDSVRSVRETPIRRHRGNAGALGLAVRYSRLMGRALTGKRIFVASPGDVAAERKLVSGLVDEFNGTDGFEQGTAFFVRGWEHLSGTVQRPQEAINELVLRDCDYVVLILGSRWGTRPQLGEGYNSGTEEEFFEALRLLADINAPMHDILILFKDDGAAAKVDDQYKKIEEFRDRLERSREILFNVFDSEFAFSRYVRGSLRQWAGQGIAPYARVVTLPEAIPMDEISADQTTLELLDIAKAKADEGLAVQAERLFDVATAGGDPDGLAAYAKFMRRAGRYKRSEELNGLILSSPEVAGGAEPESASRRAMALAGIGVVRRKVGELEASSRALEEALHEAAQSGDAGVEAYVSDNLAHTLRQLGDVEQAAVALQRSRQLRSGIAEGRDVATLVNAARESLRQRDRKQALQLIRTALEVLDLNQDVVLFATAKAVQARAHFELGDYSECLEFAAESLTANEHIKNDDGAGICESLMSRAHLALGDLSQARTYANSSFKRGLRSGNRTGEAAGYWNLAQIAAAEDDLTEAAELIDSALRVSREAANVPLEVAIRQWFEGYVDHETTAAKDIAGDRASALRNKGRL